METSCTKGPKWRSSPARSTRSDSPHRCSRAPHPTSQRQSGSGSWRLSPCERPEPSVQDPAYTGGKGCSTLIVRHALACHAQSRGRGGREWEKSGRAPLACSPPWRLAGRRALPPPTRGGGEK
eukprot:scaffold284811_cov37-Tisochrysis_lutea.AAC.4